MKVYSMGGLPGISSPDEEERRLFALQVGIARRKQYRPILLHWSQKDPSEQVRHSALWALCRIAHQEDTPMFFDQLNHPSAWIRSSAEQSLLELGHTIGPQLDLLPRSAAPEPVPQEILELSETIDSQPETLSPNEIESNYVERALHDIVNLLTPIDFELQLLEDQTELPEHIRKSIEFAAQSARFLAEIAKSTVDVRRREVTGEGLKLERLSFNQLVLEVCEHGLPRALSQERLFLQLPEQEIFLESHGTLLSRALLNLLWNACKYSPQRSLVELSLREDAEGVELEVRDRGPGLSEGDQQRLFAAFQRGTRHIGPSEQSSFGLGLSTALRLIRQLGGEIAWKQREGGGSVFQIRFVQGNEA